jgi:hypothetical protein
VFGNRVRERAAHRDWNGNLSKLRQTLRHVGRISAACQASSGCRTLTTEAQRTQSYRLPALSALNDRCVLKRGRLCNAGNSYDVDRLNGNRGADATHRWTYVFDKHFKRTLAQLNTVNRDTPACVTGNSSSDEYENSRREIDDRLWKLRRSP